MGNAILHVVNGDSLGAMLKALQIEGDIVVWREMLCEGPTTTNLLNDRFISKRKTFLYTTYGIDITTYEEKFISQLYLLKEAEVYEEIVLWFEFDLFCHLNLMACLRFLKKLKRTENISLVCSGRIPNKSELTRLSELTEQQLKEHYNQRITLTKDDIDLGHYIWSLYSKGQVRKLTPDLAKHSNFKYLSNCLRAHKERFPSAITGLNTLETTILRLIDTKRITSRNQLCGYALGHQGYYGFGDTQLFKVIDKLAPFYTVTETRITLNKEGLQAIAGTYNYYKLMQDQTKFGGNFKYGYVYDSHKNKLIKTRM